MGTPPINVLSVCSGIGGLDLAVRRALPDARTICYLEREAFCVATLATQMEAGRLDQAPVWDDLTTFNARRWRGVVDLVVAGLPCQPFSVAGKRRGDADERYIWPEFFRIVRECEPAMVFIENVPGILAWWKPIGEELSSMGYSHQACLVRAQDVGAPHRRERFFALAYGAGGAVDDADSEGCEGRVVRSGEEPDQLPAWPPGPGGQWDRILAVRPDLAPSLEPSLRRVADEFPDSVDGDPMIDRADRLRALGNAVVPEQAAFALRILMDAIK